MEELEDRSQAERSESSTAPLGAALKEHREHRAQQQETMGMSRNYCPHSKGRPRFGNSKASTSSSKSNKKNQLQADTIFVIQQQNTLACVDSAL